MTDRRQPDWLDVETALERILERVDALDDEEVDLDTAHGRILAEAVVSRVAHPPWDNSGMDGFAVRARDVRGATPEAPVTLRLVEDVPAGAHPGRTIGAGEAARIMTGAPVPDGADSVIRVEHTSAWNEPSGSTLPKSVRVLRDDDAGRNIRRRGEDLEPEQEVLRAGRPLRPSEIGVLAMVGRSRVRVRRRPRVAVLSTGDELAGPDQVEEVLRGRRIADSNSPALAAALRDAGCEPMPLGIARDRLPSIIDALERATGADALITTAGASVGVHDVVKEALERAGFELDFWRVKMRPGSPFSFGRIDGRPVFGLAGNPVSALVSFEVLVRPALLRMLGRTAVHAPTIAVRCGTAISSKRGLTHFLRVRLERSETEDDRPIAHLAGPQGSGILTSLALADGLLVVPEDADGLEAGDVARAVPLQPGTAAAATLGFTRRPR